MRNIFERHPEVLAIALIAAAVLGRIHVQSPAWFVPR